MHLYSPAHDSLKVLPWDYRLNGKVTTPLFQHLGASSWHKGDAQFILGLGKVRASGPDTFEAASRTDRRRMSIVRRSITPDD
jgi:hypothetical protein